MISEAILNRNKREIKEDNRRVVECDHSETGTWTQSP